MTADAAVIPGGEHEGEEPEDDIIPTKWERFLAEGNKAYVSCCGCCCLAFVFAMVGLTMLTGGVVTFDQNGVWDVRGHFTVDQRDALIEARRARLEAATLAVGGSTDLLERQGALGSTIIIYESYESKEQFEVAEPGGNIFTDANMKIAARFENEFMAYMKAKKYCQLAYGPNQTASADADCSAALSLLPDIFPSPAGHKAKLAQGLGPAVCSGRRLTEGRRTSSNSSFGACSSQYGSAGVAGPVGSFCVPCSDTPQNDNEVAFGTVPCRTMVHMDSEPGPGYAIGTSFADFCKAKKADGSAVSSNALDQMKDAHYGFMTSMIMGSDFNCADNSAGPSGMHFRTIASLGGPLPGYTTIADGSKEREEQDNELQNWAMQAGLADVLEMRDKYMEESGNTLGIYPFGFWSLLAAYNMVMIMDGLLAVGSITFVWLWLWTATGSFFLASVGMYEIVISVPLAIFLWGCFGQQYVGFLTIMIIFVIVGIGADCVLVLLDAYKQSASLPVAIAADPIKRFAWAYRRARLAMFVTTSTTCMGFLAAGFSSVPSISAFGFFACFVVMFDYLLCVSLFASAVVIYSRHFEQRMGGHMCTNCRCCMMPSQPGIKRYLPAFVSSGIFFVLGVILCIVGLQKGFTGTFCICFSLVVLQGAANSKDPDASLAAARPIEKFFAGPYMSFVSRFKHILVVVWVLMFIVFGIVDAVILRPPEEESEFLDARLDVQRWFKAVGTRFGDGGQAVPVHFAVGIDPDDSIDRGGVDFQEPGPTWTEPYGKVPLGKVNYDGGKAHAVLATPEGQVKMLELCETLRDDGAMTKSSGAWCAQETQKLENYECGVRLPKHHCKTGVYCFMDTVKDYLDVYTLNTSSDRFPADDLHALLQSDDFQNYQDHVKAVREKNGFGYLAKAWHTHTGYEYENGQMKVAWISINSTVSYSAGDKQEQFDMYEGVVSKFKGTLPSLFQTCQMYSWMTTERYLVISVAQAVAISTAFCGIVLVIMTGNWIMGLSGLISVVFITGVTTGIMASAGWELGIGEALCIIVVIGVSVDYSVHLAHAYNHSDLPTREEKVRMAAMSMGISLLGGLATTVGASLFLAFADVLFFRSFGTFLCVTVLISIFAALTFLMPLLLLIGPEKGSGDIRLLQRWVVGKKHAIEFNPGGGGQE
eukprot:TRINITY_DN90599_c0_g1_i1.p1 TRINITY_DN90599_c0_g1~~TRINITY_DN90599_c0_g1_i1.p1  ORF type:complete len:1158 (-),score=242.28 TRINITY_DN90599_c0_g1_i1:478-3951(-)